MDIRQNREDFITVFQTQILPKYPQAKELLEYIKSTDFFTAPASRNNHSAEPGGLCFHSLLVLDNFYALAESLSYQDLLKTFDDADIALATLCHDLCKINTYKQSVRNVKKEVNGTMQWVEQPYYIRDEEFVLGHGEKSVYIVMKYIPNLDPTIIQAIRYHMGGLDSTVVDSNSSEVFSKNKLALLVHLADMTATFANEKRPN